MRSNLDGAELNDNTILGGNRYGVISQTLAAAFAVPNGAPHVLALDPGGAARDVTLPASPQLGDFFILINMADAAEVITVKDSAGVGLTPACTPAQSEVAFIFWTGAAWRSCVALGA